MPRKFEPIRFLDFSGGMCTKVVNHLMLDSQVKLARNCILDEIGCLKKRKGYSQIGAQITAGTNILGNYYFNDADGTSSYHLVACGDDADSNVDIYRNVSRTWTKASSGAVDLEPEAKVRFESFLDYVFAFNGNDNALDSADGATWGTTNLSGAPSTPKYGRVYQDRLYFANIASHPSRVQYSNVGALGTALAWTSTDWIDINPEDGDSISALHENSGRLLIFKENSMFRWNGRSTDPDPVIDVGTSSQESVQTVHGITYFFNRHGVYSYDGGMPYLISRKIQNWIDGIDQSKLADVTAEVDTDHYYLSVGTVTIGTDTYSNVVLVYNIPLKAWTVWTMGDKPTFMGHYYSSGARYVSFGDSDGEVFKLNDGNVDDTTAIPVNIETKSYDLQTPEEEKKFTETFVITDGAKGIVEVGVKLDNYPIKTIGYTDSDVTRLPSNLEGKKMAVCLSESGEGEQWSFNQLVFRDATLMGVTY